MELQDGISVSLWNLIYSRFCAVGTSKVHVLGRETHLATIKLDLSICPTHPPIEEMKYHSVAISVFLWIPCLIFEVCH